MNELALFAGAGGGLLASELLGWRTVCAVEREAYAAQVLAQRQNDGLLPPFPIWSDVCSFDGKPWRGIIDVISGGFPCQDISPARTNNGGEAKGIAGKKSGLWKENLRIIDEVRPARAFSENSSWLTRRGLNVVIQDLAEIGYDCAWTTIGAAGFGAEHIRERVWILAYANGTQRKGGCLSSGIHQEYTNSSNARWGKDKPGVDRVADGMVNRVDRLKTIGNGQVPIVAAAAYKYLESVISKIE